MNWLCINPSNSISDGDGSVGVADFGYGVMAGNAGLVDLGSCAKADSAFNLNSLWPANLYGSLTTPLSNSDAGPSWDIN